MSGIPKPSLKQRFVDFLHFVYNSEQGTVLGRNGTSWAKVGIFYLIYYICLAGFWITTVVVFYKTLDDVTPKLIGQDSLLKSNPGLGYRPITVKESSLIRFDKSNYDSYKGYLKNINEILQKYNTSDVDLFPDGDDTFEACPDNQLRHSKEKPCKFDVTSDFANCSALDSEGKFGYADGKPCVVLKLNKVFGWEPRPLENDESVRNVVDKMGGSAAEGVDHVTVTCTGENAADNDNIHSIDFFPTKGFSHKYFPYSNVKGYMAPLLMAKFDVVPNVVIMVECKLWAQGIEHDKQTRKGLVHFEILIDEKS